MIIKTKSFEVSRDVKKRIESLLSPFNLDGDIIVRELEQGPPIDAAIVVKVLGPEALKRQKIVEDLTRVLNRDVTTDHVRNSLSRGLPAIRYDVIDQNASRLGLNRPAIVSSLLGRTRGLPAGELKRGSKTLLSLSPARQGKLLKSVSWINYK